MNAPAPAVATIGDNTLIAAYKPYRELIAEMKKLNTEKTFNYENPADNKAARSHIHKMRGTKGEIKRTHDAEKKDILELGRRIDSQANELIAEVDALIEVHAKPIREIEEREQKRLDEIKSTLELVTGLSAKADPFGGLYDSSTLRTNLATLGAVLLDPDVFRESLADATRAKSDAIIVLKAHIADADKREAEVAELERLRKAEEERQRAEREERIRQEAAEQARREAEEKAAREAEQQRLAAERRERELREAAEKAEREKQEAEALVQWEREQAENQRREAEAKAERERQEAAEREARIARETEERLAREAMRKAEDERAATAAREADKKHRAAINNAAVKALVEGGLSEKAATTAITLIAQNKVPAVGIIY